MRTGFQIGEVSRLTGVSTDVLSFWARTGFHRPSLDAGEGTGHKRLYDLRDVVSLRAIERLRSSGLSLQALRKVGDYLRSLGVDQPFAGRWLVYNGATVLLVADGELMDTLRQPGQHAFTWALVDLAEVVREVSAGIMALEAAG